MVYADLRKEVHTAMNKNDKLAAQKTREETALQKYTMIAPLLNEQLDPSAAYELRLKLAEQRVGRIKKFRKPYIVCKNYTDIFSGNGCNWRFPEKSRYSFFVGISCTIMKSA